MDKCTTKEGFYLLLKKQFEFVIKSSTKSVEPEIKRFNEPAMRRVKLDIEFFTQRRDEQMALPEWMEFKRQFERSPDELARKITDIIAADNESEEIDWQAQWQEAFFATFNPWKRREWKYFDDVADMAKGLIADAKILAYGKAIKKKR